MLEPLKRFVVTDRETGIWIASIYATHHDEHGVFYIDDAVVAAIDIRFLDIMQSGFPVWNVRQKESKHA